MANISGFDSNSISTLFSGLNNRSSRNGGTVNMGVDLSTYGLIKSGSYFKMMKSYYSDSEASSKISSSTSTAADSAKTLTNIKSTSSALVDSAKDLYADKSLFKKTEVKDSEGKTTESYDMDKIYKAVSSFVDDYNSAVKAVGKTETNKLANAGAAMVNYTNNNAALLKSVGISVDAEKHTLSIDEDKFKKSDMSSVKSLFSGNGSYAYSVAVKASLLNNYATIESSKSNTYGNSGNYTYNYTTGEMYNSTM